jgi:hypothetical protein
LDGFIPIAMAIGACTELMTLSGGDPSSVIDAVCAHGVCNISFDPHGVAVGLHELSDRVRSMAEVCVYQAPQGKASFFELLKHPPILKLLATLTDPEPGTKMRILRESIMQSSILVEQGFAQCWLWMKGMKIAT